MRNVWPALPSALALLVISCAPRPAPEKELHVAAAANLSRILPELGAAYEKQSHVKVILSYGATAQLAQQIENGAPFDVFLAADTSHVDELVKGGFAIPDSRAIYARGQLVVWAPKRPDLRKIEELADAKFKAIIIAKPELAPYGAAAIESLQNMGLWDKLESKVVYAPSIMAAKQFADTGNGDAAFTALSLIIDQPGNYFFIDEKFHKPIDQALCIVKNTGQMQQATDFTAFLKGAEARGIFKRFGYGQP
jgi:molybdate transport system substrate-binding protein